jgi:exodeoxyribonuclease VII large subunit
MLNGQSQIWTVSQITRRVKGLLEVQIGSIWVAGEISNFRYSPAGHSYFTIKDKDSQIDCVMFRSRIAGLKFKPDVGLEVIVFGLLSVYEKRGTYQIICEDMHPKGLGALQLAFEKLKKRLQDEGLFDTAHKVPIPKFPRKIGVVTSPTGAAIRDILHVIRRRFANMHIVLYPARVQGDEAADDLVTAIRYLDKYGVDVMIVGRGGGSLEDLWPFNEERVVRAIYEAETPVISAVGHEIDFTLADFAADLRAPTPSAAAEIVVQERESVLARVNDLRLRLAKNTRHKIGEARHRLNYAKSSYILQRPEQFVREHRQEVDELRTRLQQVLHERLHHARVRAERGARCLALLSPINQVRRSIERMVIYRRRLIQSGGGIGERFRNVLRPLQAQLDALSPLAILGRGYAIMWKMPARTLVRESNQLAKGDEVAVTLGKGGVTAKIQTVEE